MNEIFSDPINRVYAVIWSIVIVGGAIIGYNFNGDDKTKELANRALLAASTSRPFPYTSQMYTVDEERRSEESRQASAIERMLTNAQIASLKADIDGKIASLPPQHVNKRFLTIEKTLQNLTIKLQENMQDLALQINELSVLIKIQNKKQAD